MAEAWQGNLICLLLPCPLQARYRFCGGTDRQEAQLSCLLREEKPRSRLERSRVPASAPSRHGAGLVARPTELRKRCKKNTFSTPKITPGASNRRNAPVWPRRTFEGWEEKRRRVRWALADVFAAYAVN